MLTTTMTDYKPVFAQRADIWWSVELRRGLSGDPDQDYFSDGMTEALIAELGKIGVGRSAGALRLDAVASGARDPQERDRIERTHHTETP